LEAQLAEAAGIRADSETRLKDAAERYARAEESIASMREELSSSATVREELEARLKETAKLPETASAHSELEAQLQKAIEERTELEDEIKNLQTDLRPVRVQFASFSTFRAEVGAEVESGSVVFSVLSEKLDQEISRVQGLLVEAVKLID